MDLAFKRHELGRITVYSSLLAFLAAFPASPFSGLDMQLSSLYLTVAGTAAVLHLYWYRSENWLRPDTVFLLGFFIVHYQWLMMILASGLLPERSNFLLPMETHATYGAWLSTIAIIAWFAGYAIANPFRRPKAEVVRNSRPILIVAFLVIFAFIGAAGPSYFTADLYRTVQENFYQTVSGLTGYLFTLVEILTLLLVAMFFYSTTMMRRTREKGDWPHFRIKGFAGPERVAFFIYLIIYLVAFLAAGERGNIIALMSAIGVVYATHYRRIRFLEFISLAIVAALVFTIIGIVRSYGGQFSVDMVLGESGLWGITKNLAGSSITLYQGIDLAHSGEGYYFGQLWLSQILGVVPFLQGAFLSVTGWDIAAISGSARLTQYIVGPNPHTGYGTTFVVDIYLNFGVAGVIFFSFIFGVLVKMVSEWIDGEVGFSKYFISIVVVSHLFYLSRSSLLFPLRTLLWGLLIIILFDIIGRRRRMSYPQQFLQSSN